MRAVLSDGVLRNGVTACMYIGMSVRLAFDLDRRSMGLDTRNGVTYCMFFVGAVRLFGKKIKSEKKIKPTQNYERAHL